MFKNNPYFQRFPHDSFFVLLCIWINFSRSIIKVLPLSLPRGNCKLFLKILSSFEYVINHINSHFRFRKVYSKVSCLKIFPFLMKYSKNGGSGCHWDLSCESTFHMLMRMTQLYYNLEEVCKVSIAPETFLVGDESQLSIL